MFENPTCKDRQGCPLLLPSPPVADDKSSSRDHNYRDYDDDDDDCDGDNDGDGDNDHVDNNDGDA